MKTKQAGKSGSAHKREPKRLLGLLLGLLIGFALGGVLVAGMPEDAGVGTQLMLMGGLLLTFYLSMVVQIILHEAGHLVFGLLSGYRFLSFRVFRLMWVKQEGRIRLKRLNLTGTAGQCLMAPPEPVDGRIPVVCYHLGGVLMNLIASVVFVVLYLVLPPLPVLSLFWALCAVSGVMTALVNGIPFSGGMVNNDGRNAWSIRKHPAAMRSFYVQLKVAEWTTAGVRMKDMPEDWFAVPGDEEMQDGMTAVLGVFACNRQLDAGHLEAAEQRIDHLLTIDSGIIELHRRLLICDQIYLALMLKQDPARAETLLDKPQQKFMKAMRQFPSVLRTEYTYQRLAKRDAAGAEQVRNRFERMAKCYPYEADLQSERERMDDADALCRKQSEPAESFAL